MRIPEALRTSRAMISLAAGLIFGALIISAAGHANRRGRLLKRRFEEAWLREESSSHWIEKSGDF